MRIQRHSRKGFTFIEVILYLALTTIIVGIIFSYGWNIVGLRTKSAVSRETLSGVRLVSERIKREIRSADSIDRERSVFDETLGKLVLITDEGDMVIESSGDKISIKRGDGDTQFLHSDFVRIRNFLLTDQVSSDDKTEYVGFSFTAEAYYPEAQGRSEYQFSTPVRSGAEVRVQ